MEIKVSLFMDLIKENRLVIVQIKEGITISIQNLTIQFFPQTKVKMLRSCHQFYQMHYRSLQLMKLIIQRIFSQIISIKNKSKITSTSELLKQKNHPKPKSPKISIKHPKSPKTFPKAFLLPPPPTPSPPPQDPQHRTPPPPSIPKFLHLISITILDHSLIILTNKL